MAIIYILLSLCTLLLIALLIIGLNLMSRNNKPDNTLEEFRRLEDNFKKEFSTNRLESGQLAKDSRDELGTALNLFGERLGKLTDAIGNRLNIFQEAHTQDSRESRKEIKDILDTVKNELNLGLKDFSDRQRQNFSDLINSQNAQNTENKEKLVQMSGTIEKSIKSLQDDNAVKLEKMRETVDEKLQKTLETRLGESFKLVSDRLEAVHKGLGDMQQLATGVGDLKKVLSNVKTRGVLGEYQLENILEQILHVDQYAKNVKTKVGSNALVEFAVKMPGGGDREIWLPLDSKFPTEDHQQLMEAYETGSLELIEECRRNFAKSIKKSAADIRDKYIDPPNTTDFAILFLPFESLYAEVLRTAGLFESLQRENKIIITGPTTLAAILNSLQMGFRTLAIQKRTSEVWQLLASVKTEFGRFGEILDKTKKKLQEASNVIDDASVRTRAISKKLRDVHELQTETPVLTIAEDVVISLDDEEDGHES